MFCLLQHRDSRRRRTVVHCDRLKPCVTLTLPEATPLEELTVQRDEDRETSPLKEARKLVSYPDPSTSQLRMDYITASLVLAKR